MLKLQFLIIFLVLYTLKSADSRNQELNCVLFNEKYHEYMYAANFLFSKNFKRTIYTFPLGLFYSAKNGHNFDFTEDDRKGVWIIEPVSGRKNVYYLKNLKYEEYLYAGDKVPKFIFFDTNMRFVNTKKDFSPSDEKFMWKFERLNKMGSYFIYNVEYNEPLFADFHRTRENIRRDVLTWYKDPNGLQFSWNVKCKNDAKLD
ncbi:hypothetical protein BpHYR1_000732 [Brachionus plicatilis]|uniref:Uncharacterized protein n=1 Tax=Brachionus plicatilis TaxID=10195 RepID=A0A3M7S2Z6_BRAPC|nr:hypothetical protein BpHYR1_000732 [Brachionus plicatilis]